MAVRDQRFARQAIEVQTGGDSQSKTVLAALALSQIVNVRLTYADTDEPVPRAPLMVLADHGRSRSVDESEADAEGHARINSWPADPFYVIMANSQRKSTRSYGVG